MGKVATTTAAAQAEMKRKKKKGPPPKNSITPSAPPKTLNYDSTPTKSRRSGRRNPNNYNSPPPEFDDDDDERKEKKVKLVVRLPPSDEKTTVNKKRQHSRDYNSESGSGSGSDSDPESEDREACAKQRKINAVDRGSDNPVSVQEKKIVKVTDTPPLHGAPMESGPTTTPLPDKKLLLFVLDRLQKKDTYGVFSEPVDIDELPDYLEIVEQPMDFGTVRKKLDNGVYKTLEQLEGDVFLICSNAMLYNSSDTVYHRQARTIQDLAKRDFENLRHEGDNGEPQPKVVRRGRPPTNKNQKKLLETSSPVDRVDLSSGAAALNNNGEEKGTGSNSYNLRKAPALHRYRTSDLYVSPYRPRNGENYSEWLADWNDEFPASILRADMKYGKKQFTVDENRRDTYKQFRPVSCGNNNLPALSSSIEDMKRLVPVGVQEPLAYARSLAKYTANLGPTAWKIASKRIEHALPSGAQYGPGWVGEVGPTHSHPLSVSTGDCTSSLNKLPNTTPSTSASEGMIEAVRKLNSQNDVSVSSPSLWRTPFPSVHHQKPLYNFERNGFMEMNERAPPEMWSFGKTGWPKQQNRNVGPPDLNVRIPIGSPTTSSSLQQIGSPNQQQQQQQPDLALQL